MDLWIRSQDKKRLIKVEQLEIRKYISNIEELSYAICSINFQNTYGYNFLNLGIYKSEERALEVLAEIQNKINTSYQFYTVNKQNYNDYTGDHIYQLPLSKTVIYEMPKE